MRWSLALVIVLAACGSTASGGGGDDGTGTDAAGGGSGNGSGNVSVFDPSVTKVVVEIDYETGEEPYTGPIIGFGDTFEPTQTNIDRVFAHKKMLTIPSTLAEMQDVGAVSDEELTVQDIANLVAAHRQTFSTATTRAYYVIFVSGHFADANGVQGAVLGISIGDTITMFKDVIKSTSIIGEPNVVRYVEQSTLIHELSHSIGLVDNGIPMVTPHSDSAHRPHCDNPDCVMYWQNDGSSDAAAFAQQKLLTGSSILFDDHCLADVDAQSGGL